MLHDLPISEPMLLALTALMCGIAVAVLIGLKRIRKTENHTVQTIWQRLKDDSGTATIEFVLVFPFLLFFFLLLLQITLLMAGMQLMEHSAARAVRTAEVVIPQYDENSLEFRNVFAPSNISGKHGKIFQSAALALIPVSGKLNSDQSQISSKITQAVDGIYERFGQNTPNWNDRMIPGRTAYAYEKTTLKYYALVVATPTDSTVLTPETAQELKMTWQFGPRDAFMLEMQHDFNLSVPYVRFLFADKRHETADGPGACAVLRARCMGTLEGIESDMLPPPDVDRILPSYINNSGGLP